MAFIVKLLTREARVDMALVNIQYGNRHRDEPVLEKAMQQARQPLVKEGFPSFGRNCFLTYVACFDPFWTHHQRKERQPSTRKQICRGVGFDFDTEICRMLDFAEVWLCHSASIGR